MFHLLRVFLFRELNILLLFNLVGLGFFKSVCSKVSFPTGEENVVGFLLAVINVKFV